MCFLILGKNNRFAWQPFLGGSCKEELGVNGSSSSTAVCFTFTFGVENIWRSTPRAKRLKIAVGVPRREVN